MKKLKLYQLSRIEISNIVMISICIVHSMALYSIFIEMPPFLIRYINTDTISAVSYSLVFAMIESLILSLLILVPNIIIPSKEPKKWFSLRGVWLFFVIYIIPLVLSPSTRLAFGALVVALTLLLLLIRRYEKFQTAVLDIVDRVRLLEGLLTFIDVVAFVFLLIRNIRM